MLTGALWPLRGEQNVWGGELGDQGEGHCTGPGEQYWGQNRVRAKGEGEKWMDTGSHLKNEHVSVRRRVCVVYFLCLWAAVSVPCPYLGSTLRMRKAGLVSDRRSRFTGHSFSWEAKVRGQRMLALTIPCLPNSIWSGLASPSSA